MRTLHYLLVGAVALFAFVSCADKDVPYIPKETEYDEAWYAANATISSSDAHFAYTEEGKGTISFKAEGGSVVVYVDCGTEWTAENSAADIFGCDIQETYITVTADQNLVEEELYGTITLMTLPSQIHFATISITQNARAYITLSAEEFEFGKMGGEAEVTVESNYEWGYAYESDWFTVTENTDGSLTITVDVNRTGDDREGAVVFTAGDGAANTAVATLTITQGIKNPDDLILEYTITSGDTEIQLPIADVTYAKIDWGDGSGVETVTGDWPSHIYSEAGTYTVSISGAVESLTTRIRTAIYIGGVDFLTAVIQWGDTGLKRMFDAFRGCSNLTSLPDGPGPFENVTTFTEAFHECTSLKEVPEDLFKNCTECENFSETFYNCTSLTAAPSFEGLSKVTTFQHVFYGCTSLTTVPVNIFSGCTAVTNFNQAFYNCSSVSGESPYDEINVNGNTVKVHLYERENYPDYFTAPTSYGSCFLGCTNLDDYYSIPNSWGGPELAHPPVSRMSLNSTD